jgi:hypothetical protein
MQARRADDRRAGPQPAARRVRTGVAMEVGVAAIILLGGLALRADGANAQHSPAAAEAPPTPATPLAARRCRPGRQGDLTRLVCRSTAGCVRNS